MALYKEFISAKYTWGIWKITESLKELNSFLPDKGIGYADELKTFKSTSRKIEWLAVRVLFYTLTGRMANISYHSNGKPYLADRSAHISISHTKNYVSIIISKSNKVGIDIEKVSNRVNKIAHKFVRDDECLPADPAQRTTAFLLIWSAKEVMFKCMNEEAVDFREHMHVDLLKIDGTLFTGTEIRTSKKQKFYIYYMIDLAFVMTWTVF